MSLIEDCLANKEGAQEFESLAWMNGEKVCYEIPKGVKIISLGYRETGYDTEMTGSFECNDEFFNKLWNIILQNTAVCTTPTKHDNLYTTNLSHLP